MSKFSDEYRAGAVVMLQAEGYPSNPFAIGKVYEYLKQKNPHPTKSTLKNWFMGDSNPPPSNILDDKKEDMVEALKALTWKLLEHAAKAETIEDMSGQQAITGAGILIDKTRLLLDKPTEINKSDVTLNTPIILKTGMDLDEI